MLLHIFDKLRSRLVDFSFLIKSQWSRPFWNLVMTVLLYVYSFVICMSAGSMMVNLLEIVEELENWEAGVGLILRGAPNKSNIFCSGGDLKTVHEISGEAAITDINLHLTISLYSGCENGFRMSVFMSEVTKRLAALPLVSVCLLQVINF